MQRVESLVQESVDTARCAKLPECSLQGKRSGPMGLALCHK
ncbi:hypothetical protein ALP99_102756 [Pseudomonas syringae pv. tomato]|uniref:Uncharacterized protein n=13 Tax=Pseudomonas syringae group TaxID=136849 RepID=A0A0Q0B870_PSESX|nr:hypothetical protein ALO87_102667 [Pseudomonas syringae pv. apii]KPW43682.1 hypothetical protein ALO86_102366 [Pseudomonas syringae pv. berberidis]KPX27365.1 hypothetical protein ALO72_103586 [Pseudomonas syringae pv. delphinii]KPX71150.1 hypothetical protein ALO84_102409 [Pseudomonas syringae pv. maculicola]KPY28645.1 hypothetical protein ALO54_102622 [Pseudomonas syringae pv. philadelphi]KPY84522.1 hypothetical protein ALO94_101142 [Pseudomonas syringae pv. spinaceae]KPY89759.1 hypotheti